MLRSRCLWISLGLFTLVSSALAQVQTQETEKPTATVKPADNALTPASQADLDLLKKTALWLRKGGVVRVESQMTMKADAPGVKIDIPIAIAITLKTAEKYRSEVLVGPVGGVVPKKYLAVKTPTQFHLACLTENTYTTSPTSDDVFLTGLATGMLCLGKSGDLSELASADVLKASGMVLLAGEGTFEGATVRTLELTKPGETLRIRFFIDPVSASLAGVSLTGTQDGAAFTITEKVLKVTPLSSLPTDTFVFTPPKGAKKVKKLSPASF